MLTVECKINGVKICEIYGRNLGMVSEGESEYIYEVYEPETPVIVGRVEHTRARGILSLLHCIIDDIQRQQTKAIKGKHEKTK